MDTTYGAQGRVDELRGRAKRCRCKYCGSKLEVKRIVFSDYEDARIEIFCSSCDRIEYGVEPEIYQSAEYFIDELKFNCYPDLDENDKTRRMNIAKVCEIMAWENKNLGFLDQNGFKVPLTMDEDILGESIVVTDEDLIEDGEGE